MNEFEKYIKKNKNGKYYCNIERKYPVAAKIRKTSDDYCKLLNYIEQKFIEYGWVDTFTKQMNTLITLGVSEKLSMAFLKGFYIVRKGTIEFIDPKKKELTISLSSAGFDVEEIRLHRGSGVTFIHEEAYGKDWSFDKEDLEKYLEEI